MKVVAMASLAMAGASNLRQEAASLQEENARLRNQVAEQAAELSKRREPGGGRKLTFGLTGAAWLPQEPVIPGMMPGIERPRIILGIDVDYPPYGTLIYPPDAADTVVGGFGPDFAAGLSEVCDIEVTTIQANWNDCWGSSVIGDGLLKGWYHGCETYTHTIGTRNRYMDFSKPILDLNKEAGFIARLDSSGNPVVSPTSLLETETIVDVAGWAPTADTLSVLKNDCVGEGDYFKTGDNVITTDDITGCTGDFCTNANDKAIFMLFNGQADAIYLYSDQAYNYINACATDETAAGVNCALWNQLGQPDGYAYIHTGMPEYANAGTTLSISKKGSGLPAIIDPCIEAFIQTPSYYTICEKWGLTSSCFQTEHFPAATRKLAEAERRRLADGDWNLPTNEQTSDCSNGYCSCSS